MKKYLRMLSAAVMIGALRVKGKNLLLRTFKMEKKVKVLSMEVSLQPFLNRLLFTEGFRYMRNMPYY